MQPPILGGSAGPTSPPEREGRVLREREKGAREVPMWSRGYARTERLTPELYMCQEKRALYGMCLVCFLSLCDDLDHRVCVEADTAGTAAVMCVDKH